MKPITKKAGFAIVRTPAGKRHTVGLMLLTLLLYGGSLQAQSTLNVTGGSKTVGGQTFAYSIGEMVRTQSVVASGIVVTEGVLQPLASDDNGIDVRLLRKDDIQVYPNPASDILWIQPDLDHGGTLRCRLLDIHGRELLNKTFSLSKGKERQQISVASLAAGTYMLRISLNRKGKQFVRTFKIQKLQ